MMRAFWKCAAVHLVAFLIGLPSALHTKVALAEEVTLKLSYPKQIADLSFKELREPSDQSRSTQLVYKAPGMTLTLYIYGGGADLTDGTDSPVFTKEFESAKEAIRDPRAWKRAKQLHDGTVDLGVAPFLVPAREATFNVKSEDMKGTSYLCLAAANHVFFKIRYTVSSVQREREERNIAAIREAVGEIIRNAVQPALAKHPATTPNDRPIVAKDDKLKISVVIDDKSLKGKSEQVTAAWLGYAMARATWISEQVEVKAIDPATYKRVCEEEVAGRDSLATIWAELKEKDGALSDPYLDQLLKVQAAGFLREYVWVNLRLTTWTVEPANLKQAAYSEWATANLSGHVVETHADARIENDAGK